MNCLKPPLRIACYGFVEQKVGSVAGANFLILEELLNRGIKVDFYGWLGFTYPQELFKYENFKYIAIPERSQVRRFLKQLPKSIYSILDSLCYPLFIYPTDQRSIRQEVLRHHQARPYDVLLFLGLCSTFPKIDKLPTVSWLQGPPQTEWLYIRKLKQPIIRLCGLSLYLKLKGFYALKQQRAQAEIKTSDLLICGSAWAQQQMIDYGIAPDAVKALPYPIDTGFFQMRRKSPLDKTVQDKTIFLWLGRIDPRKRLDLLLEAYALLLQERQDVHLKIIGECRYAQGYQTLIDEFQYPEFIEHLPRIERHQVPQVMAEADVLIQPSEGENFGSSVAEALCCGLPVIVGATNGTKDYISKTSFVFDEYTPEALKQTMLQAMQAVAHHRDPLAIDARQTAEQHFDLVRVVDQLQTILETVISQPKSS